jgi:hypothetical protein
MKKFKVFIGYDAKEEKNYQTCVYSIRKHTRFQLEIIPLVQKNLRDTKIYNRPADERASNEFSITRFLTPYLAGHKGHAVFMDCDMIITRSIIEVLDYANNDHALTCVKHDYIPKENSKFLGQKQEAYPRKNWSSFVMWNCGHELTRQLTPELVDTAAPSFLHRFEHFPNESIGAFPMEFNWLVGEYGIMKDKIPFNLHYTLGSPQFEGYEETEYADVWNEYYNLSQEDKKLKTPNINVHKNTKLVIEQADSRQALKNGGCGC